MVCTTITKFNETKNIEFLGNRNSNSVDDNTAMEITPAMNKWEYNIHIFDYKK